MSGKFSPILDAVRANRRVFVTVAVAVFLLNVVLPPLVLSVARKPWDHFSFNPWLRNVPAWLASDETPVGRKLTFLSNAALYWFIADSPYDAAEWGYSATTRDVARWLLFAGLFGTYFALWSSRRRLAGAYASGTGGGRRAGVLGALLSTLGFSTMPCSVVGCGAPVLPVLGLTITGLSSAALGWINRVSHALEALVFVGLIVGIVHLTRPLISRRTAARGEGSLAAQPR